MAKAFFLSFIRGFAVDGNVLRKFANSPSIPFRLSCSGCNVSSAVGMFSVEISILPPIVPFMEAKTSSNLPGFTCSSVKAAERSILKMY